MTDHPGNSLSHTITEGDTITEGGGAIPDGQLIAWMHALENYARDWDQTFLNRPRYFTQEYWYLLVSCLIASWEGRPLTVSAASQAMKSGSNRTREERIKKAVDDGFLIKDRTQDDARVTVLRPSPTLEALMRGHFSRTLARARTTL